MVGEDCLLGLGYTGWQGDERMVREKKMKRERERKRVFIPNGLYKVYKLGWAGLKNLNALPNMWYNFLRLF